MRITSLKQRYVIGVEDKHLLLSDRPIYIFSVLLERGLKRFPIRIIGKHPGKLLPRMPLGFCIQIQSDNPPSNEERLQVHLRFAQHFFLGIAFHNNGRPLADARNKFVFFSC